MKPANVARRVLSAAVADLDRALAHVCRDGDERWIHRARNSIRALRATLSAFAPLLEEQRYASFNARLRELAVRLGPVREADVLIEHITALAPRLPQTDAAAIEQIIARCREVRGAAYATFLAELGQATAAHLVGDLRRSLEPAGSLIVHPAAIASDHLPRTVIAKPWRRLKKTVRSCGKDPGAAELHAIRIKAKRCRYVAEALVPLLPKSRRADARRFLRRLTRLQDALGTFHDAVTERDRLRSLARAGLDRYVAGELAGVETGVASAARAAWRKAWKKAARHPPSRLGE
jgi:CHAD domain-containing protein